MRFPLIAFNVNLATSDLSIARRIAEAVRFSSGGYRYVRAMGVALEGKGQVQVSTDILQYEKTPIHRVLETVRSEAARYGVAVVGCELIGLAPLDAFDRGHPPLPADPRFLVEPDHREPAAGSVNPLRSVPSDELPPRPPVFAPGIRRAPDRGYTLSPRQTALALKNALRYVPPALHEAVAPEFLAELRERGRIYGYRFRPARRGRAGRALLAGRRQHQGPAGRPVPRASSRPGRSSSTSTTTWISPSPSTPTSW